MNKSKWLLVIILISCFIVGGSQLSSSAAKAKAKPKPKKKVVAGGQMQLKGMEGNIGDWLFNGTTKLKVTSVTYPDAGPKGEKPEEGKKWVVVSVELKNASDMNANYGGSVENLTLVDNDGQTVVASRLYKKDNWDENEGDRMILPASGMKGVLFVGVPNDYKPIRLVYQHGASDPVFRVNF
jgi:hypothetical protein